jgi:hypothetical protein
MGDSGGDTIPFRFIPIFPYHFHHTTDIASVGYIPKINAVPKEQAIKSAIGAVIAPTRILFSRAGFRNGQTRITAHPNIVRIIGRVMG